MTIVYRGEVSHRDSSGGGGTIGPGDVQWMTAGSGILHEEFHSPPYAQSGGPFEMVQLSHAALLAVPGGSLRWCHASRLVPAV